jgi:DNA polymerase-3 subunit alpha
LNDQKTLDNFSAGRTKGIFQFDGGGMTNLLKELGSSGDLRFEDLVAATALYRPGPMDSGLLDEYVAIKLGRKRASYLNPNMEKSLEQTFGIMVYQEQVMQITVDLAGFTLVDADKLRKAIGKKDIDKMKSLKEQFIKGCYDKSGMDKLNAETVWNQIEAFAGYGFNKSHAVEYAIISYICMYLKTYYAVEFYGASLTVNEKPEKLTSIVKEANTMGIVLQPPHINYSDTDFEILNDNILLMPFNCCKGISDNATNEILKARLSGKFISKDDFLSRVEKRKCNKGVVEVLDKVGAFCSVEPLSPPVDASIRLKDQIALLEGLVIRLIKPTRSITITNIETDYIQKIIDDYDVLAVSKY